MTRERNDDGDTPFGAWLRHHPDLPSSRYDAENLDYIWFRYRDGHLMLIEEKRNSKYPSFAQVDTHGIIDQALAYACPRMEFNRIIQGRPGKIVYHGYHLLRFQNTNPTDGEIYWDDQTVTEAELVRLLKMG